MSDNKRSIPQLCSGFRVASDVLRARPWIIFVLVLLPIVPIATAATLNYQGYCISKRAFLPDDEFVQSAIKDTIMYDAARQVSVGYRDSREQFAKSIPYNGEEDFRAQNPNCCEIMSKPPPEYRPIYAIDRFLGAASKIVSVTYFRRYVNEAGAVDHVSKTAYVTVGNCGGVFNVGR